MAENAYWVAVYQTDEAGNSGGSVSFDYVVSRTTPVTRITTAPRSLTTETSPGEIRFRPAGAASPTAAR